MKKILEKIQEFDNQLNNKQIDFSKFNGIKIEVEKTEYENYFGEMWFEDVDVNELIKLCHQENIKLKKFGEVMTFYYCTWRVNDLLIVTFNTKKNQEPKL